MVRHFQYYNITSIKRPDNCQLTLTLFGLFALIDQFMNTKICTQCKQQKDVLEFNKNKRKQDGLQTTCKSCQKEYIQRNKKQLKGYYQDWFAKNKDKRNLYNKKLRNNNIKQSREYQKEYRSKPAFKESRRNYEKQKRQSCNVFRIKNNLRKRIGSFLKGAKKSKSTQILLGCSYQDFIVYIEQKFIDGMSWENYGLYGWHIDHVIPLSSAQDQEELEKLCHYTNLQPLWAKDNLVKGDKIL